VPVVKNEGSRRAARADAGRRTGQAKAAIVWEDWARRPLRRAPSLEHHLKALWRKVAQKAMPGCPLSVTQRKAYPGTTAEAAVVRVRAWMPVLEESTGANHAGDLAIRRGRNQGMIAELSWKVRAGSPLRSSPEARTSRCHNAAGSSDQDDRNQTAWAGCAYEIGARAGSSKVTSSHADLSASRARSNWLFNWCPDLWP